MNLRQLEKLLIAHLQESGEIRADLRWLRRAFWTLAGGMLTLGIAMLKYILLGSH